MNQEFAVDVSSLQHRYGDRVALRDVSFRVEVGEVLLIAYLRDVPPDR